jgi:hypothetical protein
MALDLYANMQCSDKILTVFYKFEGIARDTKVCLECAETVKSARPAAERHS